MQAFDQWRLVGAPNEVVILGGGIAVVAEFSRIVAAFSETPALGADGATINPLAEGTWFTFGFGILDE